MSTVTEPPVIDNRPALPANAPPPPELADVTTPTVEEEIKDLHAAMEAAAAEKKKREELEAVRSRIIENKDYSALNQYIDDKPLPGIPISDKSWEKVEALQENKDTPVSVSYIDKMPEEEKTRQEAIIKKYFPNAKITEVESSDGRKMRATVGVEAKQLNAAFRMERELEATRAREEALGKQIAGISEHLKPPHRDTVDVNKDPLEPFTRDLANLSQAVANGEVPVRPDPTTQLPPKPTGPSAPRTPATARGQVQDVPTRG